MVNPHRGEVSLTVGGKERTLRYDMNALAELQEDLGLLDINAMLNVKLGDIRLLIAFLWAGLKHQEPDLTKEVVGSWRIPIATAGEKVSAAFSLAVFGAVEEPPEGLAKQKKKDGTGTRSRGKPSGKSASRRTSSGA